MVVIVTIVKHTRNRCRHSREQVVVIVVVAALQRCCCTASQRGLDSFLLLFTVIHTVYVSLFINCVVFIVNICDERFVLCRRLPTQLHVPLNTTMPDDLLMT